MKREELKNGYYWVMPQRGYYKDKWVIATYENGMFWIHGTGEAFMPGSLTINYNKIPMTDPLPPAEGAEEINKMIGQTKDSISKRYNKNYWEILEDYHSNGRLTTNDFIDELLQEFATLHAQRLAEKMVEEKYSMLMRDIREWSDAQFGEGERTSAILHHLIKEVPELIEAVKNYQNGGTAPFEDTLLRRVFFEFADCFMLLFDAASHFGLTSEMILNYTRQKLEVNRKRKWGKPDKNGVVEHIE